VAVSRRENASRINPWFFFQLRRCPVLLVHLLLGYGVVMLLVTFQYRLLHFPDATPWKR
jgi:hypothetical protein